MQILKAHASDSVNPEDYALAIFKLERAQTLLDTAHDTDSALAQEVNTSLFWARKFSNVAVMNALDKLKGGSGAGAIKPHSTISSKPATPAKQPPGQPAEPPEMILARQAADAYKQAEQYVSAHPGDDFSASLRWFQMASQFPGTDYAMKAIQNAQQLQHRFTGAAEKEEIPDTPEMAIMKSADELAAKAKYEDSFTLYRQSLKMNETTLAHRHFAKACFSRAQQINEELKPKYDDLYSRYNGVWQGSWRTTPYGKAFDNDSPGLKAWNRERDGLRKESDVAQRQYMEAEHSFKQILKLSPEQKDFEAAGYLGLCQTVRPYTKSQGMRAIQDFLKDYTPQNDAQRVLSEYCKAEMERCRK